MFSTAQAAKTIGVSKNTLLRWLDEGLLEDVSRDWRGWRLWRPADIERARVFLQAYHDKPQKRTRRRPADKVDCAKAAATCMASFGRGYSQRSETRR